MILSARGLSKRFGFQWVIKEFNQEFKIGNFYAVTGANGSGKSTLLKMLTGLLPPTRGIIEYELKNQKIDPELWFKHISVVAPYMDLVEDLSLLEFVKFHINFTEFQNEMQGDEFVSFLDLENSSKKLIKDFSSGMKQRVKLGLAFCSNSQLIFLDEPSTNLDVKGFDWYQENLTNLKDRLVIIFSNRKEEYQQADSIISLGTPG
jgi:ABC-type multidrug transport system ATPase subunit